MLRRPHHYLYASAILVPAAIALLGYPAPQSSSAQQQAAEKALEELVTSAVSANPSAVQLEPNRSAGDRSTPSKPPKPSAAVATQSSASTPPASRVARAVPELQEPKAAGSSTGLLIRVGVAIDVSEVSIASETPAYVTDGSGQVLGVLQAGQLLMAQPTGSGLQLGSWRASQSLWIQPSRGGSVAAGRVWYRGKLQLMRRGDRLLAVNYVDLEQYLYSVVGSEMPSSWSPEALKAQAIAARSYAIAHMARPASAAFDLGATPRWQAYTGQQAEDAVVRKAVDKTAGLILSYRGGIVESLYAATDEIVAEAHGHLGASMSQTGANQLGQQGYRYTQILAAYYPGAQLARLNLTQR
jgi:hypothetical protein